MIALFDTIEAEVGPLQVVVFNIGANVRFPVLDTTAQVYQHGPIAVSAQFAEVI
ncbi:MAG: hypothetical protein M1823_008344, partial [Watsoniomyces obsoletus]